jgi:hypothetical protein
MLQASGRLLETEGAPRLFCVHGGGKRNDDEENGTMTTMRTRRRRTRRSGRFARFTPPSRRVMALRNRPRGPRAHARETN